MSHFPTMSATEPVQFTEYAPCKCGLQHPVNSLTWQLNGHDRLNPSPQLPPLTPTLPHAKATFDRAYGLIGGERRDAYGAVEESFIRIAQVWSGILGNRTVTAREVCLMMTGLKLCREANAPKADNVDDACGYLGLLAELNALEEQKQSKEMQY